MVVESARRDLATSLSSVFAARQATTPRRGESPDPLLFFVVWDPADVSRGGFPLVRYTAVCGFIPEFEITPDRVVFVWGYCQICMCK